MGQSLDRAKLLRLQTPVILNQVDLQRSEDTGDAVRNADSNMVLVYFFSIAFLMTVFGTSGYLMQSVIEEKETRVVEILITSVRPTQLLTGKVLSLGLLGLFQVLVWIVAALFVVNLQGASLTAISALTGLRIPLDTLPLLLVYFTLGYLLFAAIFGGIGAISGSLQEGPQIAIIFTLPAVIPFYVFPIFTATPNDTLPVILSIIPITAPLAMVMRSVVTVVPAWQIALSIGLLALSVIAAFWMAGRLFRVNTLLSGKVPKLREIPRLIFGRG
jgi:ABC-2 type transport system permease protein